MFIRNNKRFNIDASTTIDGVTYPNFRDAALRTLLGITEIAEPTPPVDYSEDTYYRTEQDDAPYVVYTQKSSEQIAAVMAEKDRIATDTAALEYAKAVPVIRFLATHTPTECENWVQANVTDLASAKTLLKNYAIALCVLARREFRE